MTNPHSKKRKRPAISDGMKYRVLRNSDTRVSCAECQVLWGLHWLEFDHWLALVDGGEHTVENLRPLCPFCHAKKSAREHRENCRAKRRAKKHTGEWKAKKPMRKVPDEIKAANRERQRLLRQKVKAERRV